jgi:predicted DsbA family dithiol-disulfide isomerase
LAEPALRRLVDIEPDVEITWKAFELRPEPVPTLEPRGDYLIGAWRNSVYPLAERLGMTMRLPPVQPRSRLAHEAAHWARTAGRFNDYHAAIFRAFFERGEDIGQPDRLVDLARELGLDHAALAAALEGRTFEQSVLMDEHDAKAIGIQAVPAFVAARKITVSGVQPLTALQELVSRARRIKQPSVSGEDS